MPAATSTRAHSERMAARSTSATSRPRSCCATVIVARRRWRSSPPWVGRRRGSSAKREPRHRRGRRDRRRAGCRRRASGRRASARRAARRSARGGAPGDPLDPRRDGRFRRLRAARPDAGGRSRPGDLRVRGVQYLQRPVQAGRCGPDDRAATSTRMGCEQPATRSKVRTSKPWPGSRPGRSVRTAGYSSAAPCR